MKVFLHEKFRLRFRELVLKIACIGLYFRDLFFKYKPA